MVKTYYIFRHALTYALKTGTAYGDAVLTAPILHVGRQPYKKMGRFLKSKRTDFNVSSPLIRCKQTTQIISEITGKEFILDERLTEFHLESRESLERRLTDFLDEMNEKGFEKMAICTHGAVISALIGLLTPENGKEEYGLLNYPDPGVLVIIKDGHFEEINFN